MSRDTIPSPPPAEPMKACACGRGYSAAEWVALPLIGFQPADDAPLEMRNCACGSTLAIPSSGVAVALYADDEVTERVTLADVEP